MVRKEIGQEMERIGFISEMMSNCQYIFYFIKKTRVWKNCSFLGLKINNYLTYIHHVFFVAGF
jgi:hypothetical protein